METCKERNFNGLSFKMFIPKIELSPNFIHITSEFFFKDLIKEELILDSVTIGNKQKMITKKLDDYYLKQIQTSYLLDVKVSRKEKFSLLNSFLKFQFISNRGKMYSIIYKIGNSNVCQLESVSSRSAEIKESKHYVDVVRSNSEGVNSSKLSLELFRKKLFREYYFLKENGGRKYKVTNGKFVNIIENMYCYDFEIESELTIAEDSPVSLHLMSAKVNGFVLNSEGFQITLLLDTFLGDAVSSSFITVDPWKLLEALNKRIEEINKEDVIANKIINRIFKIENPNDISRIPKGQKEAINKSINEPITVIWGPPGTGKTYTMSQIAIQLLERNETVLMVSHSNISVDGLILELYKQISESDSQFLKNLVQKGKILRYGYVRNEKLMTNNDVVSFNYALHKNANLYKKREELLEAKKSCKSNPQKRVKIEQELKSIKVRVKEEERLFVENAKLVSTTISKTSIDSLFKDKKFDTVMFDEASMAYVPHIISAAKFATKRFVCVGDFRQLAPIAQSDAKDVLQIDIFKYLNIIDNNGKLQYHPWLVMLDTQRRMHPAISSFPRRNFYQNLLNDYPQIEQQRSEVISKEPFANHSIVLLDISKTYCLASKNSDNSRYNIMSACISFWTALIAVKSGQKSIGIITPYQAQSRLIQALIYDYGGEVREKVVCSTVHQFQGSERDIIIFDAVESYPLLKPGILMSNNENEALARLVNVAVSRARGKFILVANVDYWIHKCNDYSNNVFFSLLKDYMKNSLIIDELLMDFLKNKKIQKRSTRYFDDETYLFTLINDIKNAEEQIYVSVSDSMLGDEKEKAILKSLKESKEKGVRVAVKAEEYVSLPTYWKGISWSTDENIFPLIIIDDHVLWYGAPITKGTKKDINRKSLTSQKIFFRITGRKTIEFLKSITEIQKRINDTMKKPLIPKDKGSSQIISSSGTKNQKTYDGLAAYIFKTERCPKCGKPMKLTKGFKGKYFLKCSSCGEIGYLRPETVNSYIEVNGIKCPTHNCEIKARLGKAGVYIRCECDHFIQISEI